MDKTIVTKKPETNQLVFERTFAAPRERVFGAFTSAEALAKWWGPRGWKTTTKEMNFEPGGRWHYGMKCIDESQGEFFGQESWGLAIYETIDQPNGFSYTDYFSDESAVINQQMPTTKTEMSFEEIDGTTKLRGVTTCENREAYDQLVSMGMIEGLSETWDRLEEYVQAA